MPDLSDKQSAALCWPGQVSLMWFLVVGIPLRSNALNAKGGEMASFKKWLIVIIILLLTGCGYVHTHQVDPCKNPFSGFYGKGECK